MSYGSTQKWLASAFVEHHCWQNRASHKISLSLSIIKTQVPTYYMVIGTLFYMYIIVLCNNTGIISLEIKLTRLIWEDFIFIFLNHIRLQHLLISDVDILSELWLLPLPSTPYPLQWPPPHTTTSTLKNSSSWVCEFAKTARYTLLVWKQRP